MESRTRASKKSGRTTRRQTTTSTSTRNRLSIARRAHRDCSIARRYLPTVFLCLMCSAVWLAVGSRQGAFAQTTSEAPERALSVRDVEFMGNERSEERRVGKAGA